MLSVYLFLNVDKENKTRAEKLNEKVFVPLEEMNKKIDILITNQGKLNRSFLPNEKRFQKPTNLRDLPVNIEVELNLLEEYLQDDNFTSMVSNHLFLYVDIYSFIFTFNYLLYVMLFFNKKKA